MAILGGAVLILLLCAVVWQARRIRALRRLSTELMEATRERTRTDRLTGLWEYAQWWTFAEDQSRDRQPRERVGVVFFDFDHFKELNETYGHLRANDVLAAVGARLTAASRHWRFGRFGGDEIVGLIREVQDAAELDEVCRQIQRVVSEPVASGRHLIVATVTVGRVLSVDRADRLSRLLAHADADLRRRKNARPARSEPVAVDARVS